MSSPRPHHDFVAEVGRLRMAMRLLGRKLSMKNPFEMGTLRNLAHSLTESESPIAASPLAGTPSSLPPRHLPTSAAQEAQWILQRLQPETSAYNILFTLGLQGTLDLAAMEYSLEQVVARHAPLRTIFPIDEQGVWQQVLPVEPFVLPLVPLAGEATLQEALTRLHRQPFDLTRERPLRLALFRLAQDRHVLALCIHHIAFDAWSIRILERELLEGYAARRAGKLPEWPVLQKEYGDYALAEREWLKSPAAQAALARFRARLGPRPQAFELPTDFPRPERQVYQAETVLGRFSATQRKAFVRYAAQNQVTLYALLLAGLSAVFYEHTRQPGIVLGVPFANRLQAWHEPLIGMFVNTLPVRVDVQAGMTFAALLAQVRRGMLDTLSDQALPFHHLLSTFDVPRDVSRTPLYQVVVNMRNLPAAPHVDGMQIFPVAFNTGQVRFDLEIEPVDTGETLEISFRYNRSLYRPETMEHLFAALVEVLERAARDPAAPVVDVALDEATRRQIVFGWNDTSTPNAFPDLIESFEQMAGRQPDALAVRFEQTDLTYRALNESANRLAWHLRDQGIGPDQIVAILLPRSPGGLVAMLAVLKAGAGYLPLDPTYPQARLEYMLQDSGAALVLTRSDTGIVLPRLSLPVLNLDGLNLADSPSENLPTVTQAGHLMYVLYTSGSTGQPKGVLVTRGGVSNVLGWARQTLSFQPGQKVLAITTFAFDISVLEAFLPLAYGGAVILLPEEQSRDMRLLVTALKREQPDLMQATPTTWKMLCQAGWRGAPGLSMITAGEALSATLAAELLRRGGRLWNWYGPTETTIYSHGAEIQHTNPPILIGKPIANLRSYILDDDLQPVPPGAVGEIYIAGAGLARGYINRPELTAQKFIPDPFWPGQTMYRSGDLGRYHADGAIEALGRVDSQVKLRGFRVELGEVEFALQQHPDIQAAGVVLIHPNTEAATLAAHYVPIGGKTLSPAELRQFLAKFLPPHALPTQLMAHTALPLTPNQKLDRAALAALVIPAGHLAPAEPASPLEALLLTIWQTTLQHTAFGVEDDFFELGGNSLLAITTCIRIEETTGRPLPLVQFFQNSTVRALAASLQAASPRLPDPLELPAEPITRLFERHAEQRPQAPAIFWGEQVISYAALNQAANRLAHALLGRGILPTAPVALYLEPSPWVVITMLAVIKAGAACLPIPLGTPTERTRFMLADSGAGWLLSETARAGELNGLDGSTLWLDTTDLADFATTNLPTAPAPDQPALIFYTSGSTGQPKGVTVSSRNILSRVYQVDYIHITPADVFAHVSNVGFDAATFEIWGPLVNGASLVILPPEILLRPSQFGMALNRYAVSALFLSTGYFNAIAHETPTLLQNVKWVAFGGEKADYESVRRVLEHGKPPHLLNIYGPTETTTFAACYEIPSDLPARANLPIGRAIAHTTIQLLAEDLQPVAPGAEGEIVIGGPGVTAGYLRQPNLTSQKFIPDPANPGGLRYRTGDLGRLLPDGNLEFLGRRDNQVKLRGFRIELDEIELCLRALPTVREAVVVLQTTPRGKEIIAFWVPRAEANVALLRADLQKRLPEYMIPSAFVHLPALPLNPNGKIDRRALEQTALPGAPTPAVSQSPATPTERSLLRLWQEMLGRPEISVTDNFFALGGHSLLAARLFYRIETQFGQSLPLSALFDAPTVRQLARLMDGEHTTASIPGLIAVQPQGNLPPLTFLPGADASPLYLRDFCLAFAPHRPVNILLYPGLADLPAAPSLRDYARLMLANLQRHQPTGPYNLIGHSLGGLIALEMACLLAQAGQPVTFLGLLDTLPPANHQPQVSPIARLTRRLGNLARHGFDQRRKNALRGILLNQLAPFWPHPALRALLQRTLPEPELATLASLHAERTYRLPSQPLPLVPDIFSAGKDARHRHETQQTWQTALQPAPRFFDIPGDHISALEQPHVLETARRVQAVLNTYENPA